MLVFSKFIPTQHTMNLRLRNLNLFVAFDALMKHRHISNAAKELYLTQSAMSKLLAKIRSLFRDDILVKTKYGLVATEYALALHEKIKPILQLSEELFDIPNFDPTSFSRVLKIGMPESLASQLLPTCFHDMRCLAPGLQFSIDLIDADSVAEKIVKGNIDLAITFGLNMPNDAKSVCLSQENVVCMGRQHHPVFQKMNPSIKDLLSYEHIILHYQGLSRDGFGDRALIEQGYTRRKSPLCLPSALIALSILPQSDLLFSINESFAKHFSNQFDLTYCVLKETFPKIPIYMLWPPQYQTASWHIWVREQIKDYAANLLLGEKDSFSGRN
jgi:DNA-binding transcriptional LysR family regulator